MPVHCPSFRAEAPSWLEIRRRLWLNLPNQPTERYPDLKPLPESARPINTDAPDRAALVDDNCFHCGLPLDPRFDDRLPVLGRARAFCCPGCLAVTRSIVDSGLESFYQHRREKSVTADVVPEIVRKLDFYDHPEVQRAFVRDTRGSREASLLLENIRCAACLWLNERVLRGLDGVIGVEIDHASHHARVRWDPQRIQLSEILEAILGIGYVAHPYDPTRREQLNALQRRRSTERLIFAGVIGMMVMNFAIAGYVMGLGDETGELSLWARIGRWTSLFGATALLAYPGQEFFVGAWRDLRNRRLGMDVPIVLGLGIAYLGSLYSTWSQSGDVYYDSIAMFVFLVLLARRIELRGRTRAADALDRVGRILPHTAIRLGPEGDQEVLVTELDPGDRVRVGPGEVVPADGRLTEGHSSFDESLLTGEPLPVTRYSGEQVTGGSCNVEQPVVIEIEHDSADSAVAQIHRLLTRGLSEAPRYAILAQRVATWFVGVVLLIALVTAGTWLWLDPASTLPHTVAVLIVTCPCALALATPVASAIAVGRFADQGLLTVRSDAIEKLAQCTTFAFDKTGTLTDGEFTLEQIHTFGGIDEARARAIAAALEAHSEHPLGRALSAAHEGPPVEVNARRNHVAEGIEGVIQGVRWKIGSTEFALSATDREQLSPLLEALADGRHVIVALGNGEEAHALFVLNDRIRRGAADLLRALRKHGVQRIALLSGDSQANVDRLAETLPFDEAHGALKPADKLRWIRQRQMAGERVAMLGDGINDAPTLAAADVSLSFAHATELAQVHSGLLILGDKLDVLAKMRALAEKTRAIIRQNLAWAAAYNLLAVPAAAFGLIAPWGAAIGMSLSSLLVVLNALRLRADRREVNANLPPEKPRPNTHRLNPD